jgi:hypothetical protein
MEEALSEGAAKERFVQELALLDGELSEAVDPVALDLGRWTEAGRLAAASRDTRYFGDPYFRAVLAELAAQELSQPVEQALDAIRTKTSSTPSEIDLAGLERDFRQRILPLNHNPGTDRIASRTVQSSLPKAHGQSALLTEHASCGSDLRPVDAKTNERVQHTQ